jgi:hypothetical protein
VRSKPSSHSLVLGQLAAGPQVVAFPLQPGHAVRVGLGLVIVVAADEPLVVDAEVVTDRRLVGSRTGRWNPPPPVVIDGVRIADRCLLATV